jgi:hypothetical protein
LRVNVHPRAGLHHVDDNQADNQRKRTDHFKIEQRHRTGAADRFHAFHTGDTCHDRTEDNRGDNHFNQLNEGIAKRFHLRAQFRVEMAEQNTDSDGRQYLEIQTFKQRGFHRVSLRYKPQAFWDFSRLRLKNNTQKT